MKKITASKLTLIAAVMVIFSTVYYLLLQDSFLHISIATIINHANTLELKRHLLVLGLLPMYIATMIFGAGILTISISSAIKRSSPIKPSRKKDPSSLKHS